MARKFVIYWLCIFLCGCCMSRASDGGERRHATDRPIRLHKQRNNSSSAEDIEKGIDEDFTPYTYIIEYTHSYSEDIIPSASHDRLTVTKALSPTSSDRKKEPRLISEDIRKKVEIFIEEGYDRGAYDHKGYDKISKKWNDFSEYDHKYGGVQGKREDEGKFRENVGRHGVDGGDTEASPTKPSPTIITDGKQPYPKHGHYRHYRPQQSKSKPSFHPENRPNQSSQWYKKSSGRTINPPSFAFNHPRLPTIPRLQPSPRQGIYRVTTTPYEFHREFALDCPPHKSCATSGKNKKKVYHHKEVPWNRNKLQSDEISSVKDYRKQRQQLSSGEWNTSWSPFQFVLPDELRKMVKFSPPNTYTSSETHLEVSPYLPMKNQKDLPPNRDTSHNNDALKIHTSSSQQDLDESLSIDVTRAGRGTVIKNGFVLHERLSPDADNGRSHTNGVGEEKAKTIEKALHFQQPCVSRPMTLAHTWLTRRGPPAWYTSEAPFLRPLTGQVDLLRERVFAPALRHALCES